MFVAGILLVKDWVMGFDSGGGLRRRQSWKRGKGIEIYRV